MTTITDVDGNYSMAIGEQAGTLRFTYVGMEDVTVSLPQGTAALQRKRDDEVEQHARRGGGDGIFQKNKEVFTGAVTSISNKELKQYGNKNLLTSIANVDPSVQHSGEQPVWLRPQPPA